MAHDNAHPYQALQGVGHPRLHSEFSRLGIRMQGARDEEELVTLFAETLRVIFPGADFAIRVLDSESGALGQVYATAPLRGEARARLVFSRGNLAEAGIDPAQVEGPGAVVAEIPEAVFEGTSEGMQGALAGDGKPLGLINVEVRAPLHLEPGDATILNLLASLLSLAVRNARLLQRTVFLNQYLEKLLDNANALIAVIDSQRRVTVFNRAFERLSGYGKAQVLGTDFIGWFPPEEQRRMVRVIVNSMKGRPTPNLETRFLAADGKQVRIIFNTAAVLNSTGEIEGVIAIGHDITELKILEAELLHASRLGSLGEMAADIAHELNNPLTSITMYANYLVKKLSAEGVGEDDIKRLNSIGAAAVRIQKFTRDLMTFARPQSDKVEALDLRTVVRRGAILCQHIFEHHEVELGEDFDPATPAVKGVAIQLEQIFVNLFTNACHAIGTGGRIMVALRPTVEDRVEILVSDSGPGMDEATMARIFEPFFTTKGEGQGTGLGLPIVARVLQNHEGTITVTSSPGQGATFRIILPAHIPPATGTGETQE